jgi:hypothetical protein
MEGGTVSAAVKMNSVVLHQLQNIQNMNFSTFNVTKADDTATKQN